MLGGGPLCWSSIEGLGVVSFHYPLPQCGPSIVCPSVFQSMFMMLLNVLYVL